MKCNVYYSCENNFFFLSTEEPHKLVLAKSGWPSLRVVMIRFCNKSNCYLTFILFVDVLLYV